MADALSQENDESNNKLTHILTSLDIPQTPPNFSIVPLPNKIVSWLTSLLPVQLQLQETYTRTNLGRGSNGQSGATPLGSGPTHSSMVSPPTKSTGSWELLPGLFATDNSCQSQMAHWLREQSMVPFHMWHRPSEIVGNRIRPR